MMQLGFRIIICHHYIEFVEKSKTYFGGFLIAAFSFLLFLFLYCQFIIVLYLSCEKNKKCIVSTWDVVDALLGCTVTGVNKAGTDLFTHNLNLLILGSLFDSLSFTYQEYSDNS